MKTLILYRKIFVLMLATVLLVFCMQCISSGQLRIPPDKIKDESTRYVVWIVHDKGSGSGVLINKDYRLVVTNAHVVKDYKEVKVFFAVRDFSGNIIRAQPFYRHQDHQNTLQRLGYVTRGRVIAKYQDLGNEPDLAMIELDGLPETTSPLKPLTSIDYSKMKEDERVHILGHPAQRPLWHWKAGFFKEYNDKDLLLSADAYFGNSGGPVLNKDGKLIGIARSINQDKALTFAVPVSAIIDLDKTREPVKIFSIYNNTELPMTYEIKWKKDEDWETKLIEPKKEELHLLLAKDISTEYPKIRFKDSQNSTESSESIQKLETKSRSFGIGIKDDGGLKDHIDSNDALRYQFMSDPETNKISLVKLKEIETFMIHNNTQSPLFFQYRWREDEKWTEIYIKRGEKWRFGELSEKVSSGYPIIRFSEKAEDRNDLEKSRILSTETEYFDKTTEIKEVMEQIGWNPPKYYQFKNNVGSDDISLEELKRTQRFKIQNPTEVDIVFGFRWNENDIWQFDLINPNDLKVYDKQQEINPSGSAEISYSENVSVI
ncbi:MAG: trypsin-like peptidase domain-containing protein, partial [Candidatus Poribacteria bacterium]|nr:trypsin-like peptidase domain-containing protein [Candidatus Poribacteria bacterium]